MAEKLELWKCLEALFQLGQAGIIVETVNLVDSVGDVEREGEVGFFDLLEEILDLGITEREVGGHLADAPAFGSSSFSLSELPVVIPLLPD